MKSLKAVSFYKSPENPTFFMFHGFGADANDLSALANEVSTQKPLNWVFPQGPLTIPISAHWTGYAWWNIDMRRWETVAPGGDLDLSNEIPKELPATRKLAVEFIESHKIPWSEIILGGFSQGGMLAMDLYLHAPQRPKGLVLLSTSLVNKAEWKPLFAKLASERPGGTFYQAHGKQDQVIHPNNAQRLYNMLRQSGMEGKLELFEGPHTIPMNVIRSVGSYLDSLS